MKTWRVVALGVVVLALFACNSEGGSPSEPLSAPNDPLFATNVDALLKVDKVEYIEQDNHLQLTLSLNRGLFIASSGPGDEGPDEELTVDLDLSNVAGQVNDLYITQSLDLIKPLTPPTQGLVVIAIVVPWDGKDSQGVPMTGATMVEYGIRLQFVAGGKSHSLTNAAGTLAVSIGNAIIDGTSGT